MTAVRRKRVDGERVEGLSATRQVMPYLMRIRTESAVYLEQRIDLDGAVSFLTREFDVPRRMAG